MKKRISSLFWKGSAASRHQLVADVLVKVHTGALTLFLCSRRSFPAVHEGTPPASMLSGTHGGPGPADNPHGGPADRLNRSGSTPSRPVSAVVQGQDERITRDPAYRTCSTPCWPCWYAHVRLEVRAGYEGKVWARKFCLRRRPGGKVGVPPRCSCTCGSARAPAS